MVLKPREKIIAIGLAATLGLFAVDRYLVSPYLAERARLNTETGRVTTKLDNAQRLFSNSSKVDKAWKDLTTTGGLKVDAAAAESQALHAMRDWAQSARVDLQSLKPDRAARSGDFQQIRIHATGIGTTSALASLLWNIESANIPIKIMEFRINSRKEGTDDLTFNLSVATIVFSPAPEKTPFRTAPVKGETR